MEDKSIERKIEDQFKLLLKTAEVDPKVKIEVMSTISKMDAMADILDLFTSKFIQTSTDFLDNLPDQE